MRLTSFLLFLRVPRRSLPKVYFDITIGGNAAGRIVMELRRYAKFGLKSSCLKFSDVTSYAWLQRCCSKNRWKLPCSLHWRERVWLRWIFFPPCYPRVSSWMICHATVWLVRTLFLTYRLLVLRIKDLCVRVGILPTTMEQVKFVVTGIATRSILLASV